MSGFHRRGGAAPPANPSQMGVPQLMQLAEHAQDSGHVDAACEFYEIALQKMPHHIDVLEAYAEVLLHYKNQPDRAKALLQHAVEVSPEKGYIKFLNLAQLSEGQQALGYYEKAVQILKREMASTNKKPRRKRLAREASTATVAAAELFLTDLCDEEGAERRCELLIQEALSYCPTNMEAMQAMGSLRISQQRMDEARGALLEAVRLTKAAPENLQPTYDSQVELMKLLLQVDVKAAFDWGLTLLNMDDTSAIAWFLLAQACSMREMYVDAARMLRRARIVAQHCGQDEEVLERIDNAIRELVQDMGGNVEALNSIPDLDHPDPVALMMKSRRQGGDDNDDGENSGEDLDGDGGVTAASSNRKRRNNNKGEEEGGGGGFDDDDDDDEDDEPEAFPQDADLNWEDCDDDDDEEEG